MQIVPTLLAGTVTNSLMHSGYYIYTACFDIKQQ
jgi:hypothetical protein